MSDAALEQYFRRKLGFKDKPSALSINSNGSNEPQYHEEGMHIELLRLGSFRTWPQWAPIFPNRLSRAGFYYLKNEDEVECFSCKKRIKGWRRGDRPMTRHVSLNPRCAFVQENPETPNVSLPRAPESPEPPMLPETTQSLPEPEPPRREVADSPRYNSTPAYTGPTPALTDLMPDYKNEQNRLDTFQAWPQTAYVGPEELAQAGFVFMGSGDRVQCAFCKGVVRNWAPGDRAFTEHQRLFPRCQFVQNPDAYRTLPTAMTGIHSDPPRRSNREDDALRSLHLLGIETDLPKNHTMALEQNRQQSYSGWPQGKSQTPKVLVAAGFYYIGRGDSVKCYWCDGGLRNWDAHDDPWVEHARWFPKCGHLKRTKGEDFIKAVKEKRTLPPGFSEVDAREVTARMDTPTVKQVLSMGFDKEFVRKVIHYRLAKSGDDFDTAEALLETCLNYTESPPQDFKEMDIQKAVSTSNGSAKTAAQSRKQEKKRNKKKKKKQQQQADKDSKTEEKSEENKKKENSDSSSDDNDMDVDESATASMEDGYNPTCRVCWDKDVSVVFLPCRHLVCCATCAPAVKDCPLCRAQIKGTINVFMG